jgi:hypothetical protein
MSWLYVIIGLVVIVVLAFPLAMAICAGMGWILLTCERLTNRCPNCGQRRMRNIGGIRETYPNGRGTGGFYICDACRQHWFWSNDEGVWQNASSHSSFRLLFPYAQTPGMPENACGQPAEQPPNE